MMRIFGFLFIRFEMDLSLSLFNAVHLYTDTIKIVSTLSLHRIRFDFTNVNSKASIVIVSEI